MTPPRILDAIWIWVKIGLLSFGGPAGQIALMQEEIVSRRGWVAAQSFDRGLAFSMMLPGPEAQQLATWLGWRLHGVLGGMIAGLAFILPGAVLMIGLAWIAAAHGELPLVAALFAGVQPVVIALVIMAMGKIAQRALKGVVPGVLAAAAFVALYFLGVPFPVVVAVAALAGLAMPGTAEAEAPTETPKVLRHASLTIAIVAAIILTVFGIVRATLGSQPFDDVAALFSSAALVTFGGAYAVLPFVADQAVEGYGWLDAATMLNGLAIAEATPGPLILVNTYAGYFAGWSDPSASMGAAWTGVITATLATFYTFAPSFGLILAFAPVVERLHTISWARKALAGVSAAVVGVIANLVAYLAEAALLPSGIEEPEWTKIGLFLIALILVYVIRLSTLPLIAFGLAAGLGLHLIGLL
ncbi:chromate efflux transporter [Rhodobacteraceae bacterium NNCM2]|nr:chromate efflux transporter [Coraliihabitans acroporae]